MNVTARPRSTPTRRGWMIVFLLASTAMLANAPQARAQGDDAPQILKAMSDYLAGQKTISATFNSDIEVVTPELQKIQFNATGALLLARPDKLRVSRTGGYADLELVFDGRTTTLFGRNLNAFAQIETPGTTDDLIDNLRNNYYVEAPGADLLLSRSFDALTSDVLDAKHIGRGVVDGVECEHLAFRGQDVDWQIWIEIGPNPIPHKYVITSKTVTGAPQYTLRLSDWQSGGQASADAFAFMPPEGASKVELGDLGNIDEVPPGTVAGVAR
jgi:hypothetical protein